MENYCKLELIMSVCTAPEPEKCKYYEKATYLNQCMYLLFNEYCGCLKAQLDLKVSEDQFNRIIIK